MKRSVAYSAERDQILLRIVPPSAADRHLAWVQFEVSLAVKKISGFHSTRYARFHRQPAAVVAGESGHPTLPLNQGLFGKLFCWAGRLDQRTGNSSPRWNCTLLPWNVAVVDELERRFGHADVGLNQSE
jgi:hypothetical protein